MKYFLTLVLGVLLFAPVHAQEKNPVDPNAPYLKDNRMPAFSITGVDGKEITNKQIPKYKYTCFIIFSPDCPHCQKEATEIIKYATKFKNVLFIWDSFRDMESIKKFAINYNINNQPNMIIGRDPNFTIPSFFRPRMTPFMALYLNGKLLKVYEEGADVLEMAKLIESN
jgi:thiol-disulfide isomerase/thioredoxin